MRRYTIALLLAFVPCVIPRLVHIVPRIHMNDFESYYSAAVLARQHQGAAIYGGADDVSDVKLLDWVPADTPLAVTAQHAGVAQVRSYVYPPILADLLIPLSMVPLPAAKILWSVMNVTSIVLIVFMLGRLMGFDLFGSGSLLLLLGLLFSSPVYSCLFWGQVTLILTLCWMFGIYAYMKGWRAASAFVMALAAAIKLTPLVVLVAFLIWKDWKWVRDFAISLIFFVLLMGAISSPYALTDYFAHVLPSMSRGLPEIANHTIAAAIQYLYVALHGQPIVPLRMAIPGGVIQLGKSISMGALLLVTVVPLYRFRKTMTTRDRMVALALIAMVSPAVAPVSWIHAYTVCYPALALLWGEAFLQRISNWRLILLVVCSIILNSIVMTDVIEGLARSGSYRVLASLTMFVTPLAALVLAYSRFEEMGQQQSMQYAADPIRDLTGLAS